MIKTLFFLLIILVYPTNAQESQSERWYWGTAEQRQTLVAYSEFGQSRAIMTFLDHQWVGEIWRVDNQQAIALIIDSGNQESRLYLLNRDTLSAITSDISPKQLYQITSDRSVLLVLSYAPPYVVFSSYTNYDDEHFYSFPLLLFDISQAQLTVLSSYAVPMIRFTKDKMSLRYVELDETLSTLLLQEYKLENHQRTTLHTFDDEELGFDSDRYGQRWLISKHDYAYYWVEYYLFDVATDVITLLHPVQRIPFQTNYDFIGDVILSFQGLCESACTIFNFQTRDGELVNYPPPPSVDNTNSFYEIYRASDDTLFFERKDGYWSVTSSGITNHLGYQHGNGSHLPSRVSPDGRYAFISDKDIDDGFPRTLFVLDRERQEIILSLLNTDAGDRYYVRYLQTGFFINSLGASSNFMYRYDTGETIDLSVIEADYFFDILTDGNAIYVNDGEIFRYNPKTGDTISVIDGVMPLSASDLAYEFGDK